MKDQTEGAQFLRRYASGEFFADAEPVPDLPLPGDNQEHEFLLALEDDLFDDYLSGELSDQGRDIFGDYFLNTVEGRQKLEFGRVFRGYLETKTGSGPQGVERISIRRTPVRRGVIAICTVTAVLLTGTFLYMVGRRKQRPTEAIRTTASADLSSAAAYSYDSVRKGVTPEKTADQREARSHSAKSPVAVGDSNPGNVMVCFFPVSMIDPRGITKKIRIPAATDRLRLQLGFFGDVNKAYGVHLQSRSGKNVYWEHGLMLEPLISGNGITFNVPANILAPGNYRLELEETNPDGNPEVLGVYRMEVSPVGTTP